MLTACVCRNCIVLFITYLLYGLYTRYVIHCDSEESQVSKWLSVLTAGTMKQTSYNARKPKRTRTH